MASTVIFFVAVKLPLFVSCLALVGLIFRKDCGHGW